MTQTFGSAVERLFNLLPALYRIYDYAEGKKIDPTAEGGPIKELFAIIAREYRVLEENSDQLYDDMFIETSRNGSYRTSGICSACVGCIPSARRRTASALTLPTPSPIDGAKARRRCWNNWRTT